MASDQSAAGRLPRVAKLDPLRFALAVAVGALLVASITEVTPSPERLAGAFPRMGSLLDRMLPPDTDPAFLGRMAVRLLETIQIAIAGTFFGILLSFPLAWCGAAGLSPLGPFRWAARAVVSLFRTVPDLVWALFFVSAVGLGAVAGTLTIIVDTAGFCGRFFAEAMEESDRQSREALDAAGARKVDILFSAVVPDCMPSFVNTSLFSLELAVRSSVVLGIVGAGGIGQELKTAFELFQYPKASAIILAIFVIVLVMERLTDWLRQRIG
ncbi:phosphonate ABC transporter, permease protein PhnE [Nisaea acidiphila]|uniref:Phosphonate ABC transporter, permease protein PhnE n=1 Tax=Nisaea acidiphila TaxID=1862145 RepID=A0A9J7ALS7_9PROT|nr:phosphonate ABC transporter, permease protein PhnE [Nisaea acidiphila]UUX48110.1 phosphonate ABC transporter, permease protein PhnE [Nisaea acidiphila]